MTPPTRTWLKQFLQISTLTFLGLGISRLAFPKHCRGCQCERLDGFESPDEAQKGLSGQSMQQSAQPNAPLSQI